MTPPSKVTRNDLHTVLKDKCTSNISQPKILVTVGSIQSDLILDHDIDVTRKTIREKGICPAGYFQKKYPSAVDYKTDGKPESRGMVIDTRKYLIECGEYETPEEMVEEFEELRVCDRCEQLCSDWFESESVDKIICNTCEKEIDEKFIGVIAKSIEKWIEEKFEGDENAEN